jgi:8-oxo-dGTP pyrophosphatase MutT (NUDIX family)
LRAERQRSAGGLVVRGEEVLLIALQGGKRWQLPKGHIEDGETPEETAVREVAEETGVAGRPIGRLPSIAFWFVERGRRVHNTVDYFLLEYEGGTSADYDREEVSEARWFPWEEGIARLTFENEREVARAARALRRELGTGAAGAGAERLRQAAGVEG